MKLVNPRFPPSAVGAPEHVHHATFRGGGWYCLPVGLAGVPVTVRCDYTALHWAAGLRVCLRRKRCDC